jgi:serine/threonine protein kinase
VQYSPIKRFTAAEALQHPYFDQLKELESYEKGKEYLKTTKNNHISSLFNYTESTKLSIFRLTETPGNWWR